MRDDFPRIKLDDVQHDQPGVFDSARYVDVGWLPLIREFVEAALKHTHVPTSDSETQTLLKGPSPLLHRINLLARLRYVRGGSPISRPQKVSTITQCAYLKQTGPS